MLLALKANSNLTIKTGGVSRSHAIMDSIVAKKKKKKDVSPIQNSKISKNFHCERDTKFSRLVAQYFGIHYD